MEINVHRYDPSTGKYTGDTAIDFVDGYPLSYWKLPDNHTLEPLPKYSDDTEVPVWDGKGWGVKLHSDFEIPEPEPSLLEAETLKKTLIALIDNAEKGTEIPQDVKTAVEAERVKLEPVVVEPIIKEITK